VLAKPKAATLFPVLRLGPIQISYCDNSSVSEVFAHIMGEANTIDRPFCDGLRHADAAVSSAHSWTVGIRSPGPTAASRRGQASDSCSCGISDGA
jgi:hypothetical protein